MTAIIGTAEHYAQFVRICRARIEELGIPFATLDAVCGFPERYTATLLSGGKACSVYSFFTLARALALLPAFHHDGEELAELEQRSDWIKLRRVGPRWRSKKPERKNNYGRDFLKMRARKGGMAAAKRLTRKQRSERARNAVLARWRRDEQISVCPRLGHGLEPDNQSL